MSIELTSHVFAGNPIISKTPKETDPISPSSAFQSLKSRLSGHTPDPTPSFKVLPFKKGRPLAGSADDSNWYLGWLSSEDCKVLLENSEVKLTENSFVYLGSKSDNGGDVVYWAIDVSDADNLENELSPRQFNFVDLMTLMVATDLANHQVMADLAVAGHARALLEWHKTSRFCGYCGEKTVPIDAGRRKQCSSESCKKRIYPRVDPVVIMLVIDKHNDRALLSRQSRFVPQMWTCLAGFIEMIHFPYPGESLEEAVKRETWEETGIEVGEGVYQSSQPWPVGPNSMPCQLMVGFLAYAKSLEINVDKKELEDAQWFSREDVKKAITCTEYEMAQKKTAMKVNQMCKGVETSIKLFADLSLENGELAPMFIPGPYAVAHRLIASWVSEVGGINGVEV